MLPLALLLAAACCASPAGAAPPPPEKTASPSSAADQKLIGRYTAALGAEFGFSPWTVEKGTLTATVPSGKLSLELKDARTEDDIETKALATLPGIEKRETGAAKVPVFFAGVAADELFKGAISVGSAQDIAANDKAGVNEFKALLDMKQGIIFFPGQNQPEIPFTVNGKPARRVVIRRGDDKSLTVTVEGEDYSYAVARAAVGGKSASEPAKTGAASAFFEFNAWLQKTLKDADKRAAAEAIPKFSDSGSRHPQFEKLMAQVQGGMTADKLAKAYDAAGTQAPADLAARAQAAQQLVGSGYGAAAHWKINANGKYADKNGNLTLLVRANGPSQPGGKIEETPILVKKDASGHWDLAAAVGPVTQLLINGDVVGAKVKAMKTAAAASPAEIVAEVSPHPLTMIMPGSLGLLAPAPLTDPLHIFAPDPPLTGVIGRNQLALKAENADVLSACGGLLVCPPTVPAVVTVPKPDVALPPKPQNVPWVVSAELTPGQKIAQDSITPAPAWVGARPSISPDGTVATATDCVLGANRGLVVPAAGDRARARLARMSAPSGATTMKMTATIPQTWIFQTKDGRKGACAQASMTM